MIVVPNLRFVPPALRPVLALAVAVLLAGACGDEIQGPSDTGDAGPSEDSSPELLSTLIVSNPRASASMAGAGASLSGFATSDEIVYASLPPESFPNGDSVVIRTRGTGAETKVVMVNGGFDPIPVAAAVGDTLDLRIDLSGGEPLAYFTEVPERRPPIVVRTEPPPRRRDVPLNAVMLVVFSEPIDAASLAASSAQLLLDGVPVAGTLGFGDAERLTATFTPEEPLAPGAEYTLLVTRAIEDLDGDALAEEVAATFVTESASVTVQAIIGWDPLTFELNPYYSYRWWSGPEPEASDCPSNQCPARRLTVSRISEPTAVVLDFIDTSGDGFDGVFGGHVPPGAVANATEWVGPTTESVLYRVSVTLLDGRVGSAEFDGGTD